MDEDVKPLWSPDVSLVAWGTLRFEATYYPIGSVGLYVGTYCSGYRSNIAIESLNRLLFPVWLIKLRSVFPDMMFDGKNIISGF